MGRSSRNSISSAFRRSAGPPKATTRRRPSRPMGTQLKRTSSSSGASAHRVGSAGPSSSGSKGKRRPSARLRARSRPSRDAGGGEAGRTGTSERAIKAMLAGWLAGHKERSGAAPLAAPSPGEAALALDKAEGRQHRRHLAGRAAQEGSEIGRSREGALAGEARGGRGHASE